MPTLYGIKTCDTCRKAVKAIEATGKTVIFHDVREDPLSKATLDRFLREFGDPLVNRRSTTWKNLSESERSAPPIDLLAAHPTLMKRPVIDDDGRLTLGWDKTVQASLLG